MTQCENYLDPIKLYRKDCNSMQTSNSLLIWPHNALRLLMISLLSSQLADIICHKCVHSFTYSTHWPRTWNVERQPISGELSCICTVKYAYIQILGIGYFWHYLPQTGILAMSLQVKLLLFHNKPIFRRLLSLPRLARVRVSSRTIRLLDYRTFRLSTHNALHCLWCYRMFLVCSVIYLSYSTWWTNVIVCLCVVVKIQATSWVGWCWKLLHVVMAAKKEKCRSTSLHSLSRRSSRLLVRSCD